MNLSEEQILALSPDESSKKSGKELANPARWVSKGASDQAVWGECQGSGSKPYQTQIDLRNIAFKCSCPSRKFPCKHGMGLLLLYARQPKVFTGTQMPSWAQEWINKRSEKDDKKLEKKDKTIDEAAQVKRQLAREKKIADGIEDLLVWIKDIIRNGILNVPEKNYNYWENMAKRMIDAQASGLAGMIREISNINFHKEGWQTKLIDQLSRIYLLCKAHQNISSVNEKIQTDIKSLIGFAQNQDEIKMQEGIRDDWFIMAKQIEQQEQLTMERYWLFGTQTKMPALILQFYVGNQVAPVTLTPGVIIDAELVFFTASVPLRALIKTQVSTKSVSEVGWLNNWNEVVMQESGLTAVNPFINSYPFIVKELKPVQLNNEWWLLDTDSQAMKIDDGFKNIWKLLSISGGAALTLTLTGKENNYTPLGAWQDGVYKLL